jgi:hypothetical protein
MAGDHEPEEVAEIMRMAARLERTASGMRLENGGSRTRKL